MRGREKLGAAALLPAGQTKEALAKLANPTSKTIVYLLSVVKQIYK